VSTPLLLASIPVILLASPLAWATTLAAEAVLFTGAEAFARRRLLSFVASLAILLTAAAIAVAIVEFIPKYWTAAVSALFGLAALVLLVGNLGDLGHRWRRGGSMGQDPGAGHAREVTGSTSEEGRSGP
jgi:hypothetical protein